MTQQFSILAQQAGSTVKQATLIGILTNENGCKAYFVGGKLKPFPSKLARLKLISHYFSFFLSIRSY
jgi:hypothetical protein